MPDADIRMSVILMTRRVAITLHVYGMPFEEWKAKYQREATTEQKAAFEKASQKASFHSKNILEMRKYCHSKSILNVT